jgi:hypothetical protein
MIIPESRHQLTNTNPLRWKINLATLTALNSIVINLSLNSIVAERETFGLSRNRNNPGGLALS